VYSVGKLVCDEDGADIVIRKGELALSSVAESRFIKINPDLRKGPMPHNQFTDVRTGRRQRRIDETGDEAGKGRTQTGRR
jgi:hypothetical protein